MPRARFYNQGQRLLQLFVQFEFYIQSFTVARDPFTAPLDVITNDATIQEELMRQADHRSKSIAPVRGTASGVIATILPKYIKERYLAHNSVPFIIVMRTAISYNASDANYHPPSYASIAEKQPQPSH